jgi:hypothetical protein
MVHQGQQHTKNWKFVYCCKDSSEGLNDTGMHQEWSSGGNGTQHDMNRSKEHGTLEKECQVQQQVYLMMSTL